MALFDIEAEKAGRALQAPAWHDGATRLSQVCDATLGHDE